MNRDLELILNVCVDVMGESMLENNRIQDNVFKRSVFFKVASDLTKHSCKTIGNILGKDHATVLHGINKLEDDHLTKLYSEYKNYYKICLFNSSKLLEKNITEIIDKKDLLIHEVINLRYENKRLKELLHNIPQTVKMKYA